MIVENRIGQFVYASYNVIYNLSYHIQITDIGIAQIQHTTFLSFTESLGVAAPVDAAHVGLQQPAPLGIVVWFVCWLVGVLLRPVTTGALGTIVSIVFCAGFLYKSYYILETPQESIFYVERMLTPI